FSSRRRHTRSKRDWSSDVCSSDLSDTAVRAGGRQEDLCFRVVFGKDSRGQPLWNRVVQRDGLVKVRVGHDIEDWREGFIVHDVGLLRHAHYGGLDVEGLPGGIHQAGLATDECITALFLGGL